MKLPIEIGLMDIYSEGREGSINTLWHQGQADSLVVGAAVSIPPTSVLFRLESAGVSPEHAPKIYLLAWCNGLE